MVKLSGFTEKYSVIINRETKRNYTVDLDLSLTGKIKVLSTKTILIKNKIADHGITYADKKIIEFTGTFNNLIEYLTIAANYYCVYNGQECISVRIYKYRSNNKIAIYEDCIGIKKWEFNGDYFYDIKRNHK